MWMEDERAALTRLLPGADEALSAIPLGIQEQPGNPAIQRFRELGGPGLLIPRQLGGGGATALEAVRLQRAVGSRSPSLSVALAMHSFSVATLVEFRVFGGVKECDDILQAVAEEKLWVASGFAEGRPGKGILDATTEARKVGGNWTISGQKRPCSLSRSMDLLTASVLATDGDGGAGRRAVALIPADAAGVHCSPFWHSPVLAGSESDEVVLENVSIPEGFIFFPETSETLDQVERAGFVWFQLLIAASYLGICSGLAERAIGSPHVDDSRKAALGVDLESACAALEWIALLKERGESCDRLLEKSLRARWHVQNTVFRVAGTAVELLGGMAFIQSPDLACLLGATRALSFHPPSRTQMEQLLSRSMVDSHIDWNLR